MAAKSRNSYWPGLGESLNAHEPAADGEVPAWAPQLLVYSRLSGDVFAAPWT